jgi:hypothetical protein
MIDIEERRAMRHFPFKTLILCVLLPPFVYVFSIQLIERTLQERYDAALSAVYTGDTRLLFEGSVRLQDAIQKNVDAFIDSRVMTAWGVRITISVKTPDGIYIYPHGYEGPNKSLPVADSMIVARENFRLLNEGLVKTVEVKIEHNRLLSNLILVACAGVSLLVLVHSYRRGVTMIRKEEMTRQELINDLSIERQESLSKLSQLEAQRAQLTNRINSMKTELDRERQHASATEDEMMDELVALEEKISQHLALQDRQLDEINALKEQIRKYERESDAKNRQRIKRAEAIKKRFNTLYKHTIIHNRALEGYIELTDEMRIKAEEVVHQLNDDPKMVQIKRKVFGKKNRETVFEVIFAYKGRLYFRTLSGNRVEVLVIGTKLSQNKDLAFLDKL